MKKLNLNRKIKVKLTPVGVNAYYNQFKELNEVLTAKGFDPLKRMPRIDKDGFTEMQLWDFISVFGEHIGMTKPNVITDLSLYIDESDLDEVTS